MSGLARSVSLELFWFVGSLLPPERGGIRRIPPPESRCCPPAVFSVETMERENDREREDGEFRQHSETEREMVKYSFFSMATENNKVGEEERAQRA